MKIGTLTFHRACNSGALLQAYALVKVLNQLDGVTAEIIDYHCAKIDYAYTPAFCFYNCNLLKGFIKFLIRYSSIKARNKQFEDFRKKYLMISIKEYDKNTIVKSVDEYDLYICGSDQIWNYELTGSDETYLLDFVDDSEKKASYAVSFGIHEIDQEHRVKYEELIKDYMYLSMREQSAANLVADLTNRVCRVHIDPVFLLTADVWWKMCKPVKEKKYVLIYMVGMGRIVDEMVNFAKNLATKNGLNVLFMNTEYIPYLYSDIRHIKTVSPDMFLSYINGADYIVTNSFHATCFSILFHKKFYTETGTKDDGSGKSDRVINLLNMCKLSHHIIQNGKLDKEQCISDEWENVDCIIADEVKTSLKYLNDMAKKREAR